MAKITRKTNTFTLELTEEEFEALLRYTGKGSSGLMLDLGLPEELNNRIFDVYEVLKQQKRALNAESQLR